MLDNKKIKMKLITLFLLVVASFGAFAQTMDGGYNHTLIICTDSTVYASGANKYGELGNGTQVSANTFIPVSGITGALEVASGSNHNLVLDIEGNVWVWGRNNFGQLGLGNYTDYTTPQKLSGVSNVLHIYAGDYHSYVVCID